MATWASLTRRKLRSPRAGARCTSSVETDNSCAAVNRAAAAAGSSTTSRAGIKRPFLASAKAQSKTICCAVDGCATDSEAIGNGWPVAAVTAASANSTSRDTSADSETDTAEPGSEGGESPRVEARSAVSSN